MTKKYMKTCNLSNSFVKRVVSGNYINSAKKESIKPTMTEKLYGKKPNVYSPLSQRVERSEKYE